MRDEQMDRRVDVEALEDGVVQGPWSQQDAADLAGTDEGDTLRAIPVRPIEWVAIFVLAASIVALIYALLSMNQT